MFHHVLAVPNLSNPPWQRCTEWHILFPGKQLSNGTTCSFVEDSSMVNYSHQAQMKRLWKLQEKRQKEAEAASLGRSTFHFMFPIRCQAAVAVTKRRWWYSWGCWVRWWGRWEILTFCVEVWSRTEWDSARRMSMKKEKWISQKVTDHISSTWHLP